MIKTEKHSVLSSDNISSAILKLALPTIFSQLIATIYNLADTFWVGKLNDSFQLAALSLVFPTQLAITAIGNLFGIGAGTCMSKALGANDEKRARQASSFAIYCGVLITLLISLSAFLFEESFLKLLGSIESLDGYVMDYLRWVVILGAVPSVFNLIIANMIRSEGFSLHASVGLSLGGVLNIVLDPFFVLPIGLNMEIEGAAIATLISNLVTTVYFVVMYLAIRKRSTVCFSPKIIGAARATGLDVILTGIPSALQTLMSAVSNLALNGLMIGYGEAAQAAIGITKKIDAIPFGAITGLSQGAAPLIAYNCGAKRYDKMKKTLKTALTYCVVLGCVFLAIIEFFSASIISAFIKEGQSLSYGTSFLRLHCMALPFIAVTYILVAFFQAVGAKGRAFALSIIRKGVVDIPLMYVLNAFFPITGIVACQPITDLISAISGVIMYVIWKHKFDATHMNDRENVNIQNTASENPVEEPKD